jgi:uncharacterized protein YhaN
MIKWNRPGYHIGLTLGEATVLTCKRKLEAKQEAREIEACVIEVREEQENMPEDIDFKEACYQLRAEVLPLEARIKTIEETLRLFYNPGADQEEMKANLILAYRHLEDARMRLGKAVQAYDGGTSVYPR